MPAPRNALFSADRYTTSQCRLFRRPQSRGSQSGGRRAAETNTVLGSQRCEHPHCRRRRNRPCMPRGCPSPCAPLPSKKAPQTALKRAAAAPRVSASQRRCIHTRSWSAHADGSHISCPAAKLSQWISTTVCKKPELCRLQCRRCVSQRPQRRRAP